MQMGNRGESGTAVEAPASVKGRSGALDDTDGSVHAYLSDFIVPPGATTTTRRRCRLPASSSAS